MSDWKSRATAVDSAKADSGWKSRAQPIDDKTLGPGSAQTFLEHAGNMATLGYLPQLQAATKPAIYGILNKIYGTKIDPGSYVESRDENIRRLQQEEEENPNAALAGKITGGVGGAAALPLPKLAGLGAGIMGHIARGGVYGAATGALSNPGDTEGVVNPVQGLERTGNAISGAGIGAATGGVVGLGEKVFRGLKNSPQSARQFAEEKAFKGSGAMLRDMRTAEERDQVRELGRFMLDKGLIKPGDTFDDVAQKATRLNEDAGSRLDRVYSEAGKSTQGRTFGFSPTADKQSVLSEADKALGMHVDRKSAINKLAAYFDDLAEKYPNQPSVAQEKYQKELQEYLPQYREYLKARSVYREALGAAGSQENQPAIPGLIDDLQRRVDKKHSIELIGKDAQSMRAAPEPPLTQQQFLIDLPTGESEAARLYARPGEANFGDIGGDTANRLGKNVISKLEADAQNKFLSQHSDELTSLLGKQGEIEGTGLVGRTYAKEELPAMAGRPGQTKMLLFPEAPPEPTMPLEERISLSPRQANEIKTALDQKIKYSRNPLQPDPATEQAFYSARSNISKKIDEQIDAIGQASGKPDLLSSLKEANRDYGLSKRIAEIAQDRVAREKANRMIGLTDTIVGTGAGAAAEAVTHKPGTAVIMGLLGAAGNKIGRTYGPGLMTAADKSAPILNVTARPIGKVGEALSNPEMIARLISELGSVGKHDQSYVPSEADKLISTPALQKIENKGLLKKKRD